MYSFWILCPLPHTCPLHQSKSPILAQGKAFLGWAMPQRRCCHCRRFGQHDGAGRVFAITNLYSICDLYSSLETVGLCDVQAYPMLIAPYVTGEYIVCAWVVDLQVPWNCENFLGLVATVVSFHRELDSKKWLNLIRSLILASRLHPHNSIVCHLLLANLCIVATFELLSSLTNTECLTMPYTSYTRTPKSSKKAFDITWHHKWCHLTSLDCSNLQVLGADGFGRSDTREALRRFFEVDKEHVSCRKKGCLWHSMAVCIVWYSLHLLLYLILPYLTL